VKSRGVHRAVRFVALLEAAKGFLVVVSGAALLDIAHRGAQRIAEELVQHLHLNPASHYPRIFVDAAAHLTDGRLRLMAFAAGVYSLARFVEAYGLWRGYAWARLFGIASGAIYVPFELWALARKVTTIGVCALFINLLVIGVLWKNRFDG
jgi:uncharacterized membrane protein (DUF2068 family)